MQHAFCVLARSVDCAVDGEPRRIDVVRTAHHLLTVEIHLDKARRGDLVEQHPIRIEQEMMLRSWHPCRDVSEDQVVPVVKRYQPVTCSEVHPLLPLRGAYQGAYI